MTALVIWVTLPSLHFYKFLRKLVLFTNISLFYFVGCLLMSYLTRKVCLKCMALYKIYRRENLERMQRNLLVLDENLNLSCVRSHK